MAVVSSRMRYYSQEYSHVFLLGARPSAVSSTISCSPGNAVANGVNASVATPFTKPATMRYYSQDGTSVIPFGRRSFTIGVSISGTPGNAVAFGIPASISSGNVIGCFPANAVANGVTATIVFTSTNPVSIYATPGNAVATGIQATVTAGVTYAITTTVGNAIARGILAAISNIPIPLVDATPRWSLNAKAVGATYVEFWDFISLMAIGETVSTATLQISLVSGTVDDSASILNGPAVPDGQRVLQSLKGGTAGQTYEIRCKVQSNLANSYTLASFLAVVPAEFA
jgi:hypothetical protein